MSCEITTCSQEGEIGETDRSALKLLGLKVIDRPLSFEVTRLKSYTSEDVDSDSEDDTLDKVALFAAHAKIRESLDKLLHHKRQMTFFSRWLRRVRMARVDHLCLASIAAFSSLNKKTVSSGIHSQAPRARDPLPPPPDQLSSPSPLDQLSRQQLVEVADFLIPDVLVLNYIQ